MNTNQTPSARLATLESLAKTLIPAYLDPPPSHETLRDWFDTARIPRFKANPTAKRGGGPVFYSVAAVEKFLQTPHAALPVAGGDAAGPEGQQQLTRRCNKGVRHHG